MATYDGYGREGTRVVVTAEAFGACHTVSGVRTEANTIASVDVSDVISGGYNFACNFMSTDDLAEFWAKAAGGEIMNPADTAEFMTWARLPRTETSGMITPRLPATV